MAVEQKRQCPNCGARLTGIELKCPECGYLLSNESESAREARLFLEDLQKQLNQFGNTLSDETKKASIILGATTPNTIEGYSQMLTFAYSNYLSSGRDEDGRPLVKNAWLGKAKHAYIQLQSRVKNDESIQPLLNYYAFVLHEKPARSHQVLYIIGVLAIILMIFIFISIN